MKDICSNTFALIKDICDSKYAKTDHWIQTFEDDVQRTGQENVLTKLGEMPTAGLEMLLQYHRTYDIITKTHE
jgi:hypothetical protein